MGVGRRAAGRKALGMVLYDRFGNTRKGIKQGRLEVLSFKKRLKEKTQLSKGREWKLAKGSNGRRRHRVFANRR